MPDVCLSSACAPHRLPEMIPLCKRPHKSGVFCLGCCSRKPSSMHPWADLPAHTCPQSWSICDEVQIPSTSWDPRKHAVTRGLALANWKAKPKDCLPLLHSAKHHRNSMMPRSRQCSCGSPMPVPRLLELLRRATGCDRHCRTVASSLEASYQDCNSKMKDSFRKSNTKSVCKQGATSWRAQQEWRTRSG